MLFMLVLCRPQVLRDGALRLYRSWAAQVGHACAVTWAPECAHLDAEAVHRPHGEPPIEGGVPLGEASEHWDWTIPYQWYETSY